MPKRCPKCDVPLTRDEAQSGACPRCGPVTIPQDMPDPTEVARPTERQQHDAWQTPAGRRVFAAKWVSLVVACALSGLWAGTVSGPYRWLVEWQIGVWGAFYPFYTGLFLFLLTFVPCFGALFALASCGWLGDRAEAMSLLRAEPNHPAFIGPILLLVGGVAAGKAQFQEEKVMIVLGVLAAIAGGVIVLGTLFWFAQR